VGALWRDLPSLDYMLDVMFVRARLIAAIALLGLLSACAPVLGPPPPHRAGTGPAPPENGAFRAGDFAWSQASGRNIVAGTLAYRPAGKRYTCSGATVILTPETPWSRRRMVALYRSDLRAALPTDEVRARTPQAPPGDSGPFLKRATCDNNDHFSFSGLPDGGWYVITVAKPVGAANGAGSMALMRHVMTRGGGVTNVEL
jgi:hypothetical protein